MSAYFTLFRALKNLCPDTYSGKFSTLKENAERTYGVFLKGGIPMSRRVSDGIHLTRVASVTFNVNSATGVDGIKEGYSFCERVIKTLEQTFNYTYTDAESGESVTITSIDILGDINSLGVNRFGIPCFSLNLIIKYGGGS